MRDWEKSPQIDRKRRERTHTHRRNTHATMQMASRSFIRLIECACVCARVCVRAEFRTAHSGRSYVKTV